MLKCEGWTLCKEGLPAQNGDYIVAKRVGKVDIMSYTTDGGWNTFVQADGTVYTDNVLNEEIVAWMPLPFIPVHVKAAMDEAWAERRANKEENREA